MSEASLLSVDLFPPGQGAPHPGKIWIDEDQLRVEDGESETRFELEGLSFELAGDGLAKVRIQGPDLVAYAERGPFQDALRGRPHTVWRETLARLEGDAKKARRRGVEHWLLFLGAAALGVHLVVSAVGLAVDTLLTQLPISVDVQIGQAMYQSGAFGQEWDAPAYERSVEVILERLLEARQEKDFHFEVHLIDSDQLNAFALPGGQIMLMRGLLEASESPDEVAGVLAHELQHVIRRHHLKSLGYSLRWSLLMTFLVGDIDSISELFLGQATNLLEKRFSRDQERECDQLGAELLGRARIHPRGMRHFFERLQAIQGKLEKAVQLFSTHPLSSERVESLKALEQEPRFQGLPGLDLPWPRPQDEDEGEEP